MSTNTSILKWDVKVQTGLVVLNLLLWLWLTLDRSPLFFILILQFICGLYQLISSGIHLTHPHKSIGFVKFRLLHFWGGIAFLFLFGLTMSHEPGNVLMALFVFIIPQCILYGYFLLCRAELKQLEHREFHILR